MALDRTMPVSDAPKRARYGSWTALLVLATVALLARGVALDHLPWTDELYTMLAARGWLETGMPAIQGGGVYDRADLFTILTAGFLALLGDNLVVARLPAVLAGTFLVLAVFLWTRAVCDTRTAWIAGLFMALAPLSIQVSQFARFYTLHALLFWLAAIAVYATVDWWPSWRSVVAAAAAVVCLWFAQQLQLTTLIGAVGICAWLGVAVVLPWIWRQPGARRLWWFLGLVLVGVGCLLVLALSGTAGELFERYRWTPLHNAALRNQVWFYHINLIERWPTLWPIFPFTVLIAVAAWPRPALFCTLIFAITFLALSFGGMKHLNYLFIVYPFLFVIWAIAIAQAWPYLRRAVLAVTDRALRQIAPELRRGPASAILIALAIGFLILANGAPARTLLKPLGLALNRDVIQIDWRSAQATLQPWLDQAEVVLTPNDVHALYYLDRYDIAVNGSRLSEFEGDEFDPDPRTGRPVISSLASLAQVIECIPSGLIVTDDLMFGADWGLDPAMLELLEERARPVDAPPDLHAFYWEHPPAPAPSEACAGIPRKTGDG
jgi:4-amino-4-deoxy-L-arabinose transferase-like glycosyltransferase